MLLLSRNVRYIIHREVDFRSASRYDVDVTDSGVPIDYAGGSLFKSKKFNQPIGGWDMSNVVNISFLFRNSDFNQPINRWNMSKVHGMSYMFYKSKYNHPLNNWDVSSVKYMDCMFYSSKYNHLLENWEIREATSIDSMFEKAVIKEEYKSRRCRDVAIE